MSELVQVLFASRKRLVNVLEFHPILIQCVQEQVGHNEKVSITRDIMLVAYESMMRIDSLPPEQWNRSSDMLHAQARYCQELCDTWNITRDEHNLPHAVHDWFKGHGGSVASAHGSAHGAEPSLERTKMKEELSRFHTQCQEAKSSLGNFRNALLNVEANKAGKDLLRPILEQLESIYKSLSKLSDEQIRAVIYYGFVTAVEEVYDIIIGMAQDPIMYTQLLGQRLMVQKEKILSRLKY
jgi:hypothetical protein